MILQPHHNVITCRFTLTFSYVVHVVHYYYSLYSYTKRLMLVCLLLSDFLNANAFESQNWRTNKNFSMCEKICFKTEQRSGIIHGSSLWLNYIKTQQDINRKHPILSASFLVLIDNTVFLNVAMVWLNHSLVNYGASWGIFSNI